MNNVYQTLRQELLEAYSREVELTKFAFTTTVGIIGYTEQTNWISPIMWFDIKFVTLQSKQ